MSCDRIRPLLSVYLDGELDPVQQDEVVLHLVTCRECTRVLDDFRALGGEIHALPDVPAPTRMRSEFKTRLRGRSVFPGFGTRLLVSGASAIVVVAVLIGLTVAMSAVLRRMQVAGQEAEVVATYPSDGAVDVPVTIDEVLNGLDQCQVTKQKELHVLGWEWEMGLNGLMTDEAKAHLIKKGSNLDFGARPLRRAIENHIEDPLSEELLKGEFQGNDTITVESKKVGTKTQLVFIGSKQDKAGADAPPVGATVEGGSTEQLPDGSK